MHVETTGMQMSCPAVGAASRPHHALRTMLPPPPPQPSCTPLPCNMRSYVQGGGVPLRVFQRVPFSQAQHLPACLHVRHACAVQVQRHPPRRPGPHDQPPLPHHAQGHVPQAAVSERAAGKGRRRRSTGQRAEGRGHGGVPRAAACPALSPAAELAPLPALRLQLRVPWHGMASHRIAWHRIAWWQQ